MTLCGSGKYFVSGHLILLPTAKANSLHDTPEESTFRAVVILHNFVEHIVEDMATLACTLAVLVAFGSLLALADLAS